MGVYGMFQERRSGSGIVGAVQGGHGCKDFGSSAEEDTFTHKKLQAVDDRVVVSIE